MSSLVGSATGGAPYSDATAGLVLSLHRLLVSFPVSRQTIEVVVLPELSLLVRLLSDSPALAQRAACLLTSVISYSNKRGAACAFEAAARSGLIPVALAAICASSAAQPPSDVTTVTLCKLFAHVLGRRTGTDDAFSATRRRAFECAMAMGAPRIFLALMDEGSDDVSVAATRALLALLELDSGPFQLDADVRTALLDLGALDIVRVCAGNWSTRKLDSAGARRIMHALGFIATPSHKNPEGKTVWLIAEEQGARSAANAKVIAYSCAGAGAGTGARAGAGASVGAVVGSNGEGAGADSRVDAFAELGAAGADADADDDGDDDSDDDGDNDGDDGFEWTDGDLLDDAPEGGRAAI